jgi:PBP1b-binding outer membrane lipoprotein LpoB
MKKIIAVLLVLSLVFIMGCAASTTKAPVKASATGPSAPVQVTDEGLSAEDTLGDVEADLADIDSLDEDLDMSDLDALDEELNFEI